MVMMCISIMNLRIRYKATAILVDINCSRPPVELTVVVLAL